MKHFFVYFLLIGLLLWVRLDLYKEQNKTNLLNIELKKTQNKIDSLSQINHFLYENLYPCEIELNRNQVAHEIFMKRNPKAASQFRDIISNETE